MSGVRSLELNLDEPCMKFNMDELQKIMIMIGRNGTGKTFILRLCWFGTSALCIKQPLGKPDTKEEYMKNVQEMSDDCFDEPLHGSIKMILKDKSHIEIFWNKGEVTEVDASIPDGVFIPPPIYLSKETRLFTSLEHYIKIISNDKSPISVLEFWKPYDIQVMQIQYMKFASGQWGDKEKEMIGSEEFKNDMPQITGISLSQKNEPMVTTANKTVKATSLGAGAQALLSQILTIVPLQRQENPNGSEQPTTDS